MCKRCPLFFFCELQELFGFTETRRQIVEQMDHLLELCTFLPQRLRCGANRQHLGMSGRIAEPTRRIMRTGDHLPGAHNYGADRHFARLRRRARGLKGGSHGFGQGPTGHRLLR